MEFIDTLLYSSAIIWIYMTAMFIIAIIISDNSIADIAWGMGFIIVTFATLYINNTISARNVIIALMVLAWGTRLSIRIFKRNFGKGEDWRYKKWREEWGGLFLARSYMQVFMLQGLFLILNIFPVLIINSAPEIQLKWTDFAGVLVWLAGFFFEAVADYQLDLFVNNPGNRNKILDTGLWKYSRHPNYFGEALMWWGIFIAGLSVPHGWAGIIGPVTITLLIRFVSGVPLTEKFMEKIEGFDAYKKKTNIFVPWLPGK